MDISNITHVLYLAIAIFFIMIAFRCIYRLVTRNSIHDRATQDPNPQTPSVIIQVAGQESNQIKSPIETFDIPSQHSNKVHINQEGHFVFSQPCTLQTKQYYGKEFYFEIMFFGVFKSSMFFAGLSPINSPFCSVPGLLEGTLALETNRGLFYKDGVEQSWDSTGRFVQGDVLSVAIQILPEAKLVYKLSFAKNGYYGSPIIYYSDCYLIPTIHATTSCCISVNFGQTDFIYDSKSAFQQNLGPSSSSVTPKEILPSYENAV